jgi:hypothetical protein
MSTQAAQAGGSRTECTTFSNEPGRAAVPGAEGVPVALLEIFHSHPVLGERLEELGDALLRRGLLAADDRELLILRVAAGRSLYVELGHRPIAERAGLRPGVIDRICARPGTDDVALSSRQFMLLRACDELMRTRSLRPATRQAVADRFGSDELLEMVSLVGFYSLLVTITRVFGLRPEGRAVARP